MIVKMYEIATPFGIIHLYRRTVGKKTSYMAHHDRYDFRSPLPPYGWCQIADTKEEAVELLMESHQHLVYEMEAGKGQTRH